MTWQYRVVRNKHSEDYFQIHEVYYEDGQAIGASDPMAPGGKDPEELQRDLGLMLQALELPVLREETILGSPAPPRPPRDTSGALMGAEKSL